MGGIYNTVNLHVYHYAGYSQRSFELYNPIKYVDPDGRNETIHTDEGRQIHKAIFEIYKAANAPDTVTGNSISMSKALSDLGKVDEGLGRTDLGLKPDIWNMTTNEIYEIKPDAAVQHLQKSSFVVHIHIKKIW